MRRNGIGVAKVKAHAIMAGIAAGYPAIWKAGNSYADAAAKLGCTLHRMDSEAVSEAIRALLLVTVVAKYLAQIHVEAG